MTSASSGITSTGVPPCPVDEAATPGPGSEGFWFFSISKLILFSSREPAQADHQAAVLEALLAQLESAGRDGDAPLEAAIGNFQTADGPGESLGRHRPLALQHERAPLDHRAHT